MVRTKENQTVNNACLKGGIGETEIRNIVNSADELYGKGRLFGHTLLAPGNSIGDHMHDGDNEIYYILKGTGTYNDNGTPVNVKAGDTTICSSGEVHGIVNNGDDVLEMIALILY